MPLCGAALISRRHDDLTTRRRVTTPAVWTYIRMAIRIGAAPHRGHSFRGAAQRPSRPQAGSRRRTGGREASGWGVARSRRQPGGSRAEPWWGSRVEFGRKPEPDRATAAEARRGGEARRPDPARGRARASRHVLQHVDDAHRAAASWRLLPARVAAAEGGARRAVGRPPRPIGRWSCPTSGRTA